jgi:hypothetical protein
MVPASCKPTAEGLHWQQHGSGAAADSGAADASPAGLAAEGAAEGAGRAEPAALAVRRRRLVAAGLRAAVPVVPAVKLAFHCHRTAHRQKSGIPAPALRHRATLSHSAWCFYAQPCPVFMLPR